MRSTLPCMPSEHEHLDVSALETWLWDAACAMCGAADIPKKDFILPLVFSKRLSDVFEDAFAAAIEQFGSEAVMVAGHPYPYERYAAPWQPLGGVGRAQVPLPVL